jgi:hypothetical protein
MFRASIALVLLCSAFLPAWAQGQGSQGCLPSGQLEPVLVSNPNAEVTFACRDATALELIQSTGRQTRKPIGVVLGEDPTLLSKTKRPYSLFEVDAESALMAAVVGTGYTVEESGDGFLVIAGDLTPRQRQVLTHEYLGFQGGANVTMAKLGSQLTILMESEIDDLTGFGGSTPGSANDENFTLEAMPPSTVQEIADRIVSLGSKGLWILTTDALQRTSGSTDTVQIEPYQHYSNLPATDE